MASIKEKIHAEIENIELVLKELKQINTNRMDELVVLVGCGAFLQNIYTGIENI